MRAAERRSQAMQSERVMAEIANQIAALFKRYPGLSGFTVAPGLNVTDVAMQAWPGDGGIELLVQDELAEAIAQIADQYPDACGLLRDRTFARALH